jgi:endo-1,4-beta-D-glucanase Y
VALAVTVAIDGRATANPTDPFLWPYNQVTNITFDAAAITQAWQEWKAAQITSANAGGEGRLRVIGGISATSTVSEGQGYGILFASVFDDQATLDGLWLFTADHLNAHGLMDWHIGNPGQRIGPGAATDGDEDIALGMLNACVKVQQRSWPASPRGIDYCSLAAKMIDAIYEYEIDKAGGGSIGLPDNQGNELLPGDSWALKDYPRGIVNLSYFSPGYLTVFGKFTNRQAEWQAVNQRNYALVNLAQDKPGNCSKLVPNWSRYDGEPQKVPWQPDNSSWWSYDAARLAWRVAVDRRWYGSAESKTTMNEIGSFFSSAGLANIGEHSMNGQRTGGGPSPFFVANAASAIWAAERLSPVTCGAATGGLKETAQSAFERVLKTKDTPNSYYGNAWRILAMLLMTGNFPNFYEMAAERR